MRTVMIFEHCKNLFAVDISAEVAAFSPSVLLTVLLKQVRGVQQVKLCVFSDLLTFLTSKLVNSFRCRRWGHGGMITRDVAMSASELTSGFLDANEGTIIEDVDRDQSGRRRNCWIRCKTIRVRRSVTDSDVSSVSCAVWFLRLKLSFAEKIVCSSLVM